MALSGNVCMKITCWGTRGSIPVSGPEYIRYGGDTPCVEIQAESGDILLIDTGSGARKAGIKMASKGCKQVSILYTHVHWDHLLGLPFFRPIYDKNTLIDIYGCPFANGSFKDMIARSMNPPHFPVLFDELPSEIVFHKECSDGQVFGSITVEPIRISHPNMGVGFKFIENGKTFVYLTDNELTFRHDGGLDFKDYCKFSEGADLLIHDAEFKEHEYTLTKTWGHSVYTDALKLALEAEVGRFGLFHHNQDRSDEALDGMVDDCRQIISRSGSGLECFATAVGMEINL